MEIGSVHRAKPLGNSCCTESYKEVQSEIAELLSILGCPNAKVAVSEVFSPGRFTKRAGVFGMIPGTAFDLRTDWDLSDDAQAQLCWDKVKAEDPYLLRVSNLQSILPAAESEAQHS